MRNRIAAAALALALCAPAALAPAPSLDRGPASVIFADGTVTGPHGEPIILPEGAVQDTTPVVLLDGIYVPEESPDGGSPVGWADNSPAYGDGWIVQVDDTTGQVGWVLLPPSVDDTRDV